MKRRFTSNPWFIAGCMSVILVAASTAGWLGYWRESLVDRLFTARTAPGNIVIAEIDEQSIASVGQWPWPRAVFGTLVSRLSQAKAIGIDVNFKEQSRLGQSDDAAFAIAIRESSVPVVLTAEWAARKDGAIASLPIVSALTEDTGVTTGFPNLIIGSGGTARVIRYRVDDLPSFSLTIASAAEKKVFSFPAEPVRINYRGPRNTYPSVPVKDIISRATGPEFFKDAIVLVGATASDLQDFHETPFGLMSGVEIQANVLSTLLDGNFFRSFAVLNLALIIGMALTAAAVVHRCTSVRTLAALLAGTLIIYGLITIFAFERRIVIDPLYPPIALALTAAVGITTRYRAVSGEKKFIHDAFSRYLAPQVVKELMDNPEAAALGGKRADLTILFSDIRDFTTLSESMPPERLTSFLNRYLTRMADIILATGGVVDKYIGDAIMAFWGAPIADPDHASRALGSAVAMASALEDFNHESRTLGDPEIAIGVGINTGPATVGNMGSEKRFDYTVLGDSVNLSSRLEGLTKIYGVSVIASDATWNALSPEERDQRQLLARELDRVRVKGKNSAVTVFEIMSAKRYAILAPHADLFDSGRAAYYSGDWDGAISHLNAFLDVVPNDAPATVLRDRCHGMQYRPMETWDGVFEMTSK